MSTEKREILKRAAAPRVWLWVTVPTLASMFLFFYAIFFIHVPSIREDLLHQKHLAVKNLVDSAWNVMNMMHRYELQGSVPTEKARKTALDILRAMRYGPEGKDYFWVNDMDGVLLMHPYRTDLVMTNVLDFRDRSGKRLFKEFVDVVRQDGAGYVDYLWQWKDDSTRIAEKISYVRGFKPWGWVIGSGLYLQDVDEEAAEQLNALMLTTFGILGFIFFLSMVSIYKSRTADRYMRESAEMLKVIFNQTFQFIGMIDKQGRMVEVNQTAVAFANVDRDDVIGKYFWEGPWWSHSKTERQRMRDAFARSQRGEMARLETTNVDKAGDVHVLDVTIKPVVEQGRGLFLHIIEGRDITERKQAENALRDSERFNRMLFDQSTVGLVLTHLDGTIEDANTSFTQMVQLDLEQLLGMSVFGFESDRGAARDQAAFGRVVEHGVFGPTERTYHLPNGDVISVNVSGIVFEDGGEKYVLSAVEDISDRVAAEQELLQLNEELETRVSNRTRALEESLNDLKRTQGQLVESEKMASLGNLVAGVAHEINTPIGIGVTTITFLAQKAKEMRKLYDDNQITRSGFEDFIELANESAAAIQLNLRRASELIQSFKQVAVDQTTESLRDFELNAYIHEILRSMHSKYKRTDHTISVTGPEVGMKSYPGVIMQVLTNLIMNSLVHGFDGIHSGNIVIGIEQEQEDRVTIVYSDDGVGMDRAQLQRVFDPFFTTRRGQGGTGLGMHIVYNLVTQKLHGTIKVESAQGAGTIFTLDLPTHTRPDTIDEGSST